MVAPRLRPLLWCIALVLLAHAWLLHRWPATWREGRGTAEASRPLITPALSLRRIEPVPAAGAARLDTASHRAAGSEGAQSDDAVAGRSRMVRPRAEQPTVQTPTPAASEASTPPVTANPSRPANTAAGASSDNPATSPATRPSTSSAAGTAPGPLAIAGSTRLRYLVQGESRGRPYQVSATLLWQHDGQQYEARYEVGAWLLGSRTQTSRGRITAEGLAPQRFGDRLRSEQAAHFQRDKGLITFSSNAPDAPLQPGAQDRLSVLLQLGAIIGGDPKRHPPQSTIQIQTAGTRDAEPWLFRVIGLQSLPLPGGTLEALKLERLPRREYDQHIEVWLAPALEHLPVRLRITQGNGDLLDQQWLASDKP